MGYLKPCDINTKCVESLRAFLVSEEELLNPFLQPLSHAFASRTLNPMVTLDYSPDGMPHGSLSHPTAI
jgi:hypothetical protein